MKKKDGTFSQCAVHVVHPCKLNLSFIELFIYHLFNIYLFNEFSWTSYSSFLFKIQPYHFINQTGLSLRAGGRGFSPATKRVAPSYFYWKIEQK